MSRVVLLLAGLAGCVLPHKAVVAAPGPLCGAPLEKIAQTTYPEATREAVRAYLDCVVRSGSTPLGVPDLVRGQLERNPYPAATAREPVLDWFFDTRALAPVPESLPAMRRAIDQLRDQALARRAMGELDLAEAADARREKLQRLLPILEQIAEGA
jgi:hypothetical protein